MIYVKKMAITMYEGSPGWSVKRNEYFINQIIADTKRACKQEIKKQIEKLNPEAVVYLAGIFDAQYLIDQAEVKEDKE